MLVGIVVGILASILLFILDYSRLPIIRHQLTGNEFESSVRRPPLHEQLLEKHGQESAYSSITGLYFLCDIKSTFRAY